MQDLNITTVCDFNTGKEEEQPDYLFNVSIDTVLNVDEKGKQLTNFVNQPCYLDVNHSTNVKINNVIATSGNIVKIGNQSRSKTQQQFFTSNDVNNPTKFNPDVIGSTSILKNYGRVGKINRKNFSFGMVQYEGDILYTPFLVDLKTTYNSIIYRLDRPKGLYLTKDETWPIGVVFYLVISD